MSGVTVTCASPCLRDGMLHVEATIADDAEVLGADVTLDLGGPAVPLAPERARSGRPTSPLRRFPFEHFAHGVVATVTARDGARNEASVDASAATTVTRLRVREGARRRGLRLGHPAVMQDGTVVTAGTNGKVYFVGWDGSGAHLGRRRNSADHGGAARAREFGVDRERGQLRLRAHREPEPELDAASAKCDTDGPIRGSLAFSLDDRVSRHPSPAFVYA